MQEGEWKSIRSLVERMFSTKAESFYTGKVVRSSQANFCVFLTDSGQQPIPMVANDFTVTYYDTVWNGSRNVVTKKTAKVTVQVPKPGDTVVVAREMGTRRIPRCLGKLIGKNWILTGTD